MERPLLRHGRIERRDYQVNIARSCSKRPTLVVLPTGMGKTVIATLVIADRITEGKKVLFLAPTKPLVAQHARTLADFMRGPTIIQFTGEVPPPSRTDLWQENDIIVSTPQVIENDLESGSMTLGDVSLVVFDEAHRAVGDYAYVPIGKACKKERILTMGMTASPGSDPAKILEVCDNLGIVGVEIRTDYDPDVVNYIHDIDVKFVPVEVPENLKKIVTRLRKALDKQIQELRKHGFLEMDKPVTRRDLLDAQKEIQRRLASGEKQYKLFRAATLQAMAMKIDYAIEFAESQGIDALREYFKRMVEESKQKEAKRASKLVVQNFEVLQAMSLAKDEGFERPKLDKVIELLKRQFSEKEDSLAIVFTHYRDTSLTVTRELEKVEGLRPVRFVGQSRRGEDRGLRQREQVEAIKKFKDGVYNVLVATRVAEEGLDIPSTDLVIFYEPIPSEIRTIQRRGRTGRKRPGKVVVLGSRATRDEWFHLSAKRKEWKMHRELERLRRDLKQSIFVGEPGQETFADAGDRISGLRRRLEKKEEKRPTKHTKQSSLEDHIEDY
ncbi:MAG: DEAD/DEAH box helicase [Thermoplasmata archaeon]